MAKKHSNISAELQRMEEDCTYSAKSHFNAAARWNCWNYIIGLPSVVLSAAASIAFFDEYPTVAGSFAVTVAILSALMTFLKPAEKSASHKNAGDQYLSLRSAARLYREIELETRAPDAALDALKSFSTRRDELNQASPSFSRGDFLKARKGIEQGEATHKVDGPK